MSKREKYEFVRQLYKDLEQDFEDDSYLCDVINKNHMKLIQVKTSEKRDAMPKKALTLLEFNAIR